MKNLNYLFFSEVIPCGTVSVTETEHKIGTSFLHLYDDDVLKWREIFQQIKSEMEMEKEE